MEKNKSIKMLRKEKGITLIALVITIIVLLILAGISIAMLTGQNGILNKAAEGRQESVKGQAKDEVSLAVNNLMIEDKLKNLTQEQKRTMLENDVKKYKEDSTVEISGTGFLIKHRGYEFEVSNNFQIVAKEPFNAQEWDKKAATEDVFVWRSNDSSDPGYGVVIGYTEKVQNYTTLRYPTRCTEITVDDTYMEGTAEETAQIRNYTKNVKEIELPETVTKIGFCAFGHMTNGFVFQELKKINIPNSVTEIGARAFYDCDGFENIEIPNSVQIIGQGAFWTCSNLKKIILPEGLTEISELLFFSCSNLETVKIPASVTSIGREAFRDCIKLTNLEIPDSVKTIGEVAFGNVPHITYNGTATGSPWGATAIN